MNKRYFVAEFQDGPNGLIREYYFMSISRNPPTKGGIEAMIEERVRGVKYPIVLNIQELDKTTFSKNARPT